MIKLQVKSMFKCNLIKLSAIHATHFINAQYLIEKLDLTLHMSNYIQVLKETLVKGTNVTSGFKK